MRDESSMYVWGTNDRVQTARHNATTLANEMQERSRSVKAHFTKALGRDEPGRFAEMAKTIPQDTKVLFESL